MGILTSLLLGALFLHNFGPGMDSAKNSEAKALQRVENCFIAVDDSICAKHVKSSVFRCYEAPLKEGLVRPSVGPSVGPLRLL